MLTCRPVRPARAVIATSPSAVARASRRSSARSTDWTDLRARFATVVASFTARNLPFTS